MNERVRILVVEDDMEIQEEIEDVLAALGYEHDWAESQQEARELLETRDYHCVLADLEIPVRTGRGFAKIEFGRKLIEQIPQLKGRGAVPVIVMTGYHQEGLNLTTELLGNGVMEFISKPFGNGTSGKSLSDVIQRVLDRHRRMFPPGTLPGDPPEPFKGGVLAYYPDHVELDREIILECGGAGHAWDVMRVLRTPRRNGRLPRLSAPKLAKAVDPTGQLSEGAIASCVHDIRVRISNMMLEKANVVVGREDVIANQGKGYHLAEQLTLEEHDRETDRGTSSGHVATEPPSGESDVSSPDGNGPLTGRQRWILGQVRKGVKLTRVMVEERFEIGAKQAKRELSGLSSRGLIEFERRPRPGHYGLGRNAARA